MDRDCIHVRCAAEQFIVFFGACESVECAVSVPPRPPRPPRARVATEGKAVLERAGTLLVT